jgi:hypothetical protein
MRRGAKASGVRHDVPGPAIDRGLSLDGDLRDQLPAEKAARTKDLSSCSPTQQVLTNFGNVLFSGYAFSLPPGPIFALHSFHLVATALMLDGTSATTRARLDRRRRDLAHPNRGGASGGPWPIVTSGRQAHLPAS